MTLELKELAGYGIEKLCDILQINEDKQRKIYEVYQRAAEMDEEMRELKKEEKIIRIHMNAKVGR